jgi:hypothetical protein
MHPGQAPRFMIHRLDCPDAVTPYAAFWRVDYRLFCVGAWSDAQWQRLPESDCPGDARRLSAGGWLVVRTFEEPPHTAGVGPEQPDRVGPVTGPTGSAPDTSAPGR